MAWSLACAATISRWTPASTSFASARVRPKSAMSTRPSGRLISTTSAHDPSPSAPISTSLKTQATYPPSVRERARKYPTAVAPPISRRSLDCVLVWKYDRFARSLGALVTALQEFRDLGVDFISHTQAIDTTTPMGRLFFHVIGSFAEFERDVIVERVRAGLANARAKGKRLGRPVRDPGAQARVVALKGEGLSLRQIAARECLSASGVRKMLKRAGIETAAASALVPVSEQA